MRIILSILILIAVIQTTAAQKIEKILVYFDFDKYELTPGAKNSLDSFKEATPVSLIKKIDLYGHCDAIGDHTYNDLLSVKRVEEVKKYLSKYVNADGLDSMQGYGKRIPLNNNSDRNERALNRRVEIIVHKQETPAPVVAIKKEDPPKQNATLAEIIKDTATKAGSNIILRNMNFYYGLHRLLPQSRPLLLELLNVMLLNPTLEIEIQGHVCCISGSKDAIDEETRTYNLSVTRSKAIYDFLVNNGVSARRLSYKGFGHSRPLFYPEDTDAKRTANRRVEIKIIKK